jgi:hypothetical protein
MPGNVPWVITFTASHRPKYTGEVLAALALCRGVEKYLLLPCVEPGNDEVRALFDAISFAECHVTVHPERLGCGANTLFALEQGFSNSDYVIHLEDDTVPAQDALEYFEYCREAYRSDKDVFTITGYPGARDYRKVFQDTLAGRFRTLIRQRWFTPWGWATWSDRFSEMRYDWNPHDFDARVNCVHRGERSEIAPVLSRIQNIGAELGVHVPSPEWHRQHQFLPFWAGSIEVPTDSVWQEETTEN